MHIFEHNVWSLVIGNADSGVLIDFHELKHAIRSEGSNNGTHIMARAIARPRNSLLHSHGTFDRYVQAIFCSLCVVCLMMVHVRLIVLYIDRKAIV